MPDEQQSLGSRFMDWVRENHASQPSLGAELKAMTREAAKSIHSTMDQVFFGTPAGPGEPGAPLNPTMQEITQDRETVYGSYDQALDSYAERSPQQEQQQKGMER